MNLSLYIARRYLLSKKSHNAINIISGVSVCGVALATLALVCTLSVFNGFQELVAGFFTAFDPELKITAMESKTFDSQDSLIKQIRELPEVEVSTLCIEENAMIQYKNRQAVVTVKGVEDNFEQLTAIDSILYGYGDFILHDEIVEYGIFGAQLTSAIGSGIRPIDPIEVYAPKRNVAVNMANPTSSFTRDYLYSPGVVFAVNQEKYDASYVLTSLDFARRLFDYDTEITSLELKLKPEADVRQVQKNIRTLLGGSYEVKNRYEQQADVFRIMEIEKLISYLFLSFILLVACFNIIGSLSMLIIDKKEDVRTLRNLGADNGLITRIFFTEGCLISFVGALVGILLGVGLCLLQEHYGLIALGSQGGFVVDAYPVAVQIGDVVLVFLTVLVMGGLSVWYPVRYLSKKLTNG
ncbi:MAG: FtsX-like permease family protein [Bacteroidaceae bacterium]|nr:FtsX-like permease family protein [Bacteroidaceae bacterium]